MSSSAACSPLKPPNLVLHRSEAPSLASKNYIRIQRAALNIPWYIRSQHILLETAIPSIHQLAAAHATDL